MYNVHNTYLILLQHCVDTIPSLRVILILYDVTVASTCCWSDKIDWLALSAIHHLLLKGPSSNAHGEAVLHQRKEQGKSDNIGAASNDIHFLGVIDITKYQSPHNLQ